MGSLELAWGNLASETRERNMSFFTPWFAGLWDAWAQRALPTTSDHSAAAKCSRNAMKHIFGWITPTHQKYKAFTCHSVGHGEMKVNNVFNNITPKQPFPSTLSKQSHCPIWCSILVWVVLFLGSPFFLQCSVVTPTSLSLLPLYFLLIELYYTFIMIILLPLSMFHWLQS